MLLWAHIYHNCLFDILPFSWYVRILHMFPEAMYAAVTICRYCMHLFRLDRCFQLYPESDSCSMMNTLFYLPRFIFDVVSLMAHLFFHVYFQVWATHVLVVQCLNVLYDFDDSSDSDTIYIFAFLILISFFACDHLSLAVVQQYSDSFCALSPI